jgi:hypothetical protein
VDYYESEARGLGLRFLRAAESALAYIIELPQASAPLHGNLRRKAVNGFPYCLLYRLHGDELRVLAVMHKRRRPLYWVGRD